MAGLLKEGSPDTDHRRASFNRVHILPSKVATRITVHHITVHLRVVTEDRHKDNFLPSSRATDPRKANTHHNSMGMAVRRKVSFHLSNQVSAAHHRHSVLSHPRWVDPPSATIHAQRLKVMQAATPMPSAVQ